jgi:anti-sigma regulatory factor (Ser/Thr protein kinase)
MTPEESSRVRPRKVSRYSLEPAAGSLTSVREFIRATLKPFKPIDHIVPDIVCATHEAVKNAVEHNPGVETPVEVVCKVMDDSVLVEVSDRGRGFDHKAIPPSLPDPEALTGRGIFIIFSLMDEVEAKTGEAGTRITMLKRFAS